MNLAERLRKAREHVGLSQRELSARLAETGETLSAGQIGKLEIGERQNPRASDLSAIARACGVRQAWLIDGAGPMLEPPPEQVGFYQAARVAFVAQEDYEGRREEALSFLAHRDANMASAGAEDHAPDWWLATLREEFRRWRQPAELPEGNPRPRGFSKLPQRR